MKAKKQKLTVFRQFGLEIEIILVSFIFFSALIDNLFDFSFILFAYKSEKRINIRKYGMKSK